MANVDDWPCIWRFTDYPKYWHEAGPEKVQRTLEAAEDGALVLNFELIDIARRNVNAALNFINRVGNAKSPGEVFALQVAHSWTQFGTLLWQAEELRALATGIFTDIAQASGGRSLRLVRGSRLEGHREPDYNRPPRQLTLP